MKAEGKFLLSYNDCEFIRNLYDAPGIQIDAYTRINNIKQRYDNGAQFPKFSLPITICRSAAAMPRRR